MLSESEDQIVLKAEKFAKEKHQRVNQFYGILPYSYHLDMLFEIGNKYLHLLPSENQYLALASCFTHDLIEDARVTYNDLKKELNEEIAEITFLLTTEKGRTREERANEKYYEGIRSNNIATFVKLCDRIANAEHSAKEGSDMFSKYEKENSKFVASLMPGNENLLPMFVHLNKIFKK